MARRFRLTDLVPFDAPRESDLKHITDMYLVSGRRFAPMYQSGLPWVVTLNGINYLTDGNQRAI